MGVKEPEYISELKQIMGELQSKEVYIFFYSQIFLDFIFSFVDSPQKAIKNLEGKIPGTSKKLAWAMDFNWPILPPDKVFMDKERWLFRAAKDVITLMSEHLQMVQRAVITEIELLITLRENADIPITSPMDNLYMLELYHHEHTGEYVYLNNPFRVFYDVIRPPEMAELYGINSIADLCRFEFVKMIEHDIFIKKCKNCERFFIPKCRADAEYCEHIYGSTNRKCSEVGATIRYEKKVAENPILDAHKKAYRRFNSRTRVKKMTQNEFMLWAEQAAKKRDECLAGTLPFDEFKAWLEQGRIRRSRSNPSKDSG